MSEIEEKIKETWTNINNLIEDEYKVSSEKTLVFLFAMEFMKLNECNFERYVLDFENNIYAEVDSSDTFLDLKINDKEENKKYALEFKFPRKSSNGNSNQTEIRKKVYKDIARLQYLKERKGFFGGFFLMMTDENPYVVKSKNRDNTYDTSNRHIGSLAEYLSQYSISDLEFKFKWEVKDKYSYLKVIKV